MPVASIGLRYFSSSSKWCSWIIFILSSHHRVKLGISSFHRMTMTNTNCEISLRDSLCAGRNCQLSQSSPLSTHTNVSSPSLPPKLRNPRTMDVFSLEPEAHRSEPVRVKSYVQLHSIDCTTHCRRTRTSLHIKKPAFPTSHQRKIVHSTYASQLASRFPWQLGQ